MKRHLYDDEHLQFGESFRRFLASEVTPYYSAWEHEGIVPREVFAAAGAHGFLGMGAPPEYGGVGCSDFRFNAILSEQLHAACAPGFGILIHNDICLPYFFAYATAAQCARWLPGLVSGELIAAIAMTEPGTGSDLAAIATRGRRDGEHYVVNGVKTFITNGLNADLIIVAVRTDERQARGARAREGISLLVVERDMPGFTRGRNLEKIGQHAQDTAELFFEDVRVPVENLLGNEGEGFGYLTSNLAQERLSIAVAGVAAADSALTWTLDYVRERTAFGRSIGSFQNTRFVLAEIRTEIDVGRAYVDDCVRALNLGLLSAVDAAQAKLWCTELQGRVVDRCVQLFGGYGYMAEYPIARAYSDARVTRIYAGTNEIMKEIISRSLGLGAGG
jgi:alkylation response protein AidB-like acyl-CoA dehydrogenase